jgi:hypothetical protein
MVLEGQEAIQDRSEQWEGLLTPREAVPICQRHSLSVHLSPL